jgi:hypothetical protein
MTYIKIKFISIALLAFLVASLAACRERHVPVGVSHLFHLINPPSDLYEPIVVDTFPFWEKGISKSYILEPKYIDIYEVGILAENELLPVKEKFAGKIKIEFFQNGHLVSEHIIVSFTGGVYAGNDLTQYKKALFINFKMPLKGRYKNNIIAKITALEPDLNLQKYGDSLKLYIAVSSSP